MKKNLMLLLTIILVGCGTSESSKELSVIPFLQKDKYGYFNIEGKIVINPQFSFATCFREELALVKTTGENGKWGFINKEGRFVINAVYKDATVFKEGLAWVVSDNTAPSAIDKNGEIKFTFNDAENVRLFSEGLAAFSKSVDSISVNWGFVDKTGKIVINQQFIDVGNFYDGKCAVKNKEGKWGFIDKTGKIIINYQFDDVQKFNNGKGIVYLDNKAGVIDSDGKYFINPQFKNMAFDKDNYLIYQDDKVGWCDKNGKILINPQFEEAEIFGDNKLACIKSGDKYGYIDNEGKIIINPQFDEASQFINNIAFVKTGDKYGLIDYKGKYIVNPQFDNIGWDVYSYLNDYSIKSNINSDYLDVNAIIKVINLNNPESISFNDNFQTILNKFNKSENDFSAYNENHTIFDNKKINNDASYGFAVIGKLKELDSYTYNYHITKEKPDGFLYALKLSGKALSKVESVQKAFIKKLKEYNLIKKGYVDNNLTFVYKNDKNLIIITSKNESFLIVYILKKDFEINNYLNKIVTNKLSNQDIYNKKSSQEYETYVDSTAAPSIDSTANYEN